MEKGFWKRVFCDTGLYYAAASVVILTVKLIMTEKSIYEQLFSVPRMLFLLCFCFVLATANRLLTTEKLNGWLKLLIHSVLTFSGFFGLVYAPLVADGKYQSSGFTSPNIFIVIALVALVYAVLYGTWFIISSKRKKKKNIKSEYKSVYKDKK